MRAFLQRSFSSPSPAHTSQGGSLLLKALPILLVLGLVLALPFLFRPKQNLLTKADETLVIISPHNEAIRYEFSKAFADFYLKTTGRTVRIDWRQIGGASDIAKYLQSEFTTVFRNAWEASGRPWTHEVETSFDNPRIIPAPDPSQDTPAQAARRAFLESKDGIGIDLLFGGGAYDFIQQAAAGRLVDSGLIRQMPEVFQDKAFPSSVSGEPLYDTEGRWIGACVASFGICYNTDSLKRLGVAELPASWSDLGDPLFFHQIALADPTKSGSAAKAYEMIIQQQMQEAVHALPLPLNASSEKTALEKGWIRGLRIIQRASANTRYFTDSASVIPVDVSQGNAAMGMCIDFYGRFQSEAVQSPEGTSRLRYFTPYGGSSIGADPIGLLRGAPHKPLAVRFMEYVISIQGQKLWNFRVGTPGGPEKYALRRLPIRKELYDGFYQSSRSDPSVDPYQESKDFTYHPEWTGPLFGVLRLIVQTAFIDTHKELKAAWESLRKADFPPKATAVFEDFSAVDYSTATDQILPILRGGDRLAYARLTTMLGNHFRQQYALAQKLAQESLKNHSTDKSP